MPFINITTNAELNKGRELKLKTALGEAITALPGKRRFPVFEGKDAAGKTTGYVAVGTGKATGPHGELVIIYQFAFKANRAPSFNPPPRMVNQPAIEMTDMENAQRTAYNAALMDALSQLRR